MKTKVITGAKRNFVAKYMKAHRGGVHQKTNKAKLREQKMKDKNEYNILCK